MTAKPAPEETRAEITLTVNGSRFRGSRDQSLLDLLKAGSVEIPAACAGWGTGERIHCHLCLVEIEGDDNLHRACATAVRNGMVVRTDTPALAHARRDNLKRMFDRHYRPERCQDCIWNGGCILHTLARQWHIQYEEPKWDDPANET